MEKVNVSNLDDKLKATSVVLLDFSSPGCAPCVKVQQLIAESLAGLDPQKAIALEVDIVENAPIAMKYMVLSVPTVIVFHRGREIQRLTGIPRKEKLRQLLQSLDHS